MSQVVKKFYNLFLRRTSTYLMFGLVGAFMFERGVEVAADTIFEYNNQGVSNFINRHFTCINICCIYTYEN